MDFGRPVASVLKSNLLLLSKPYTKLARRLDGDSERQIGFRNYLTYVKGLKPTHEEKEKWSERKVLIKVMKNNSPLPEDMLSSFQHFYDLRCSLYHELASADITETDIETLRQLVSEALFVLHGLAV
jgi:hypothetical protein